GGLGARRPITRSPQDNADRHLYRQMEGTRGRPPYRWDRYHTSSPSDDRWAAGRLAAGDWKARAARGPAMAVMRTNAAATAPRSRPSARSVPRLAMTMENSPRAIRTPPARSRPVRPTPARPAATHPVIILPAAATMASPAAGSSAPSRSPGLI